MSQNGTDPNQIVAIWSLKRLDLGARQPWRDAEVLGAKLKVGFAQVRHADFGFRKCRAQPAGYATSTTTEIEDLHDAVDAGDLEAVSMAFNALAPTDR